jgi:hypothetical protein
MESPILATASGVPPAVVQNGTLLLLKLQLLKIPAPELAISKSPLHTCSSLATEHREKEIKAGSEIRFDIESLTLYLSFKMGIVDGVATSMDLTAKDAEVRDVEDCPKVQLFVE